MTDDALVIRAEMPGIDPDKDVEITVADGLLTIRAEQRSESTEENEGRTRSEFRYGSFERTLRVPRDVNVDEITASYKDGILEVRVPSSVSSQDDVRQIPVKRS
jgi:HSP20 family protein